MPLALQFAVHIVVFIAFHAASAPSSMMLNIFLVVDY
jgi:hypothetical protein